MHTLRVAVCVLTVTVTAFSATAGAEPRYVPYVWKNVQIVGGGFVDGFVFHPTAKDVLYARTDIGGAYRRGHGATTARVASARSAGASLATSIRAPLRSSARIAS